VESLSDLPLDHLQLDQRAFNAAVGAGCKSIADVVEAVNSGTLAEPAVGCKTVEEINRAIDSLRSASGGDGRVDWQEFWKVRPVAQHRLALTSAELEQLGAAIRGRCLGALHLQKACSALTTAGISTVGLLIDAVKVGIPKLPNFGAGAHREVVSALTALSQAIQDGGDVDWCEYARLRGFPVIPADESGKFEGETLLQQIRRICETIVNQQFDDRAWQIFRRRLLLPESQQETLESLGSVYDLTRERVRQIEAACLDAIRKALLEDDYQGLAFRLRPQIGDMFREAREHFDLLGVPAWRESRWIQELALVWQIKAEEIERYDRLFAELLGYRRARLTHVGLEPLIIDENTSKGEVSRLISLVDTIHDILSECNGGMDAFRLTKALKAAGKKPQALDEMPVLTEICSSAEAVGHDLYRLRFSSLRGRAEQVYRILSEHGEPVHYIELIREINRQLPTARRIRGKASLVNQLSKDSRLVPIGKSGKWALSEWNLETGSIVSVIERTS